MATHNLDHDNVPGTEYLVDVSHSLGVSHANAGSSDVVLIPQPTACGSDPLTWSMSKKYYQLFLLALYACAFSMGENLLGAAWTTVSNDTGVSISNLNAGGALNYLLLGFVNIFWIPAAMKIGRRPVFLATTAICLGAAIWTGMFHGLAQWMLAMILNGVGTSAYQAVIQLAVFDMFYVHQRGRGLSYYLFGQQLGSIIGLITGGHISDTLGWRWSQFIVAIIEGVVLLLLFFTFEETLFPRYLFLRGPEAHQQRPNEPAAGAVINQSREKNPLPLEAAVEPAPDFPKRTLLQRLKPYTFFTLDRTTYWSYFVRPFFLFGFPNIVIAAVIFAFGCTAGIVSFNTISEILTEPPYDWSTTSTGLVFLAALVGNVIGWATGTAADHLVVRLARRNGGIKVSEQHDCQFDSTLKLTLPLHRSPNIGFPHCSSALYTPEQGISYMAGVLSTACIGLPLPLECV